MTEQTRPTMTRAEVMTVIDNLLSTRDLRIANVYGHSLSVEEVYEMAFGDDDAPLYRPDVEDEPFDPEREGWTGWNPRAGQWQLPDIVVATHPTAATKPMEIHVYDGSRSVTVYYGAVLPHATVVSILLANGYKPEREG